MSVSVCRLSLTRFVLVGFSGCWHLLCCRSTGSTLNKAFKFCSCSHQRLVKTKYLVYTSHVFLLFAHHTCFCVSFVAEKLNRETKIRQPALIGLKLLLASVYASRRYLCKRINIERGALAQDQMKYCDFLCQRCTRKMKYVR